MTALRSSFGVDVADVPVRRGPEAGRLAHELAARAFTHDATVYLPDDAGPVDAPGTRALLAHELVHAAQQRRFGAGLPDESSPDGRRLEDVAVATEHWIRGDGPRPAALVHRPPSPESVLARTTADQVRGLAVEVERLATPPSSPQRAPTPPPADPDPPVVSAGPPGTGPTTIAAPALRQEWSLPGWAPPEPPVAHPDITGLRDAVAGLTRSVAELAERPPPDLDDPLTLDDLTTKLFGRLRRRLRRELLVDRERAGRLGDFG
ncbi:MAG TPA: DUF4157 domain-containing protein [Pseudonocardiaceae bacterium]|nr:DUF4157 domain-containing protein [Pseudonocardiaceae bacterium]